MPEIRCYFAIDAAATRTAVQWQSLIGAARNKPMIQAIRIAGDNRTQPHNKVFMTRLSVNPVRRYLLGRFEIDTDDREALEAVLITQCAARGINQPNVQARLRALLEAEVREAATDLGAAFASQINVAIIGFGLRMAAISEAQAVVIANAAVWESAV